MDWNLTVAQTLEKYEFNINSSGLKKTIVFSLLGIITSSCQLKPQTDIPKIISNYDLAYESLSLATTELPLPVEPPLPDTGDSHTLELTPSELQEFDNIMLDLDPDQQLVTNITQWKLSTTVHITTGPGFTTLSQERQNEIKTGMQEGLGQICLCSPHLKFNPEAAQPLTHIGYP